MTNRSKLSSLALILSVLPLAGVARADKFDDRARDAADALTELTSAPDRHVPDYLIARATCIAVIPHEQTGAFFFGGSYGRGLVSCRNGRDWSLPSYMWVAGGSYGIQFLYKSSDEILLFYGGENAIRQAAATQLQLGGDASFGAGIKGREVDADLNVLTMSTAILSYSRTQGLYFGVSLTGTFYMLDRKANARVYSGSPSAYQLLKSDSKNFTGSSNGMAAFMEALGNLPNAHSAAAVAPAASPAPTPAPAASAPVAAPTAAAPVAAPQASAPVAPTTK